MPFVFIARQISPENSDVGNDLVRSVGANESQGQITLNAHILKLKSSFIMLLRV